jgi:hypothetical protein
MKIIRTTKFRGAIALLNTTVVLLALLVAGGCYKTPRPSITYFPSTQQRQLPTGGKDLSGAGIQGGIPYRGGTSGYGSSQQSLLALHPAPSRDLVPSETVSLTQSAEFYSATEELWVISRPVRKVPTDDGDFPRSGALISKTEDTYVPLPLKHTDVKASVSGYIASVQVTQQFENPYSTKIEAVYVFPLPENSAVNEFLMIIGDRRIRGIIRERQEAERIYHEARRQGYVASLLTQERPNIFTQSVANIEPGKQIDVEIKYFNTLSYMDGWFENICNVFRVTGHWVSVSEKRSRDCSPPPLKKVRMNCVRLSRPTLMGDGDPLPHTAVLHSFRAKEDLSRHS